MNTTGKFVFALVIVAGLAASGVAAHLDRHSPATSSVPTIRLDAVIVTPANDPWKSPTGDTTPETIELAAVRVTPADVEPETIALAPVTVTPTEADWLYAEAHGVTRPAIALAPVVVTPTEADWLYAEARGVNQPTKALAPISGAEADGEFGVVPVVMQDLAAFKPGQYLNTGAALRVLDVLVFGNDGR